MLHGSNSLHNTGFSLELSMKPGALCSGLPCAALEIEYFMYISDS